MYYKLIACKVLQREIASLIFNCPHTIDVTMVRQQYHDTPQLLKRQLQEEIDRIDDNTDIHTNDTGEIEPAAILFGYGLCSNALAGLKSKKYPLVIPRAHDCATLIMGSKEKYQDYFKNNSGSFFYTKGWMELGAVRDHEEMEQKRAKYMEEYDDEDTVEYLMEMEEDMLKHYNSATYVNWPQIREDGEKERVQAIAEQRGWQFQHLTGADTLLKALFDGDWDEEKFLIVPPGREMMPSVDERIIKIKEQD